LWFFGFSTYFSVFFFFQAEDGIRDSSVTGVQTCALPISRRHRSAGAIDVEVDLLVGILALEEQHLRDDHVRDVVVDGRAKEDDAVLEQPRVDVVRSLTAVRLLDHERHRDVGHRTLSSRRHEGRPRKTTSSWLSPAGTQALCPAASAP